MTLVERLRTCPNINDARLCIGGVPELIVPVALVEEIEAALETQAAEIARLRGLLGEAEAGLEDVINPLRKIQRDAAEQGARLSGMAYAVANDLHFVRDIARTALSKLRAEKEDG